MSLSSWNEFGRAILRSKLLERAQIEELGREFARDPRFSEHSAEAFARFLVEHGDVTKYQAERLLAGRTEGFFFGGCKILDRIGAGGMGKVYLAEQLKLGRKVALKVLTEEHAEDAGYIARFQREARAAAALKHPNVVQVYDVGQDGDTHFIIMELVEGTNLQQKIKNEGPLPVEQSVEIIEQVARGLQHAHEHGIVHRDIKPSNLVLTPPVSPPVPGREVGEAKILDLGLARKFDAGESLTQEGHGLGTPDYMAPEQFRDAHSADIRSDIYSLGCTWYCLLAGRPPFADRDRAAKALAHLGELPEPIQNVVPAVPESIANMIETMMAKESDDRYQSPAELLADIQLWRTTGTARATAATRTWQESGERRSAPATSSRGSSHQALAPAEAESSETLVRRPATSVPMTLVYLVPVMAALVLGGVYMGLRYLQNQSPAVIYQDADNASIPERTQAGPPGSIAASVPSGQESESSETRPPHAAAQQEPTAAAANQPGSSSWAAQGEPAKTDSPESPSGSVTKTSNTGSKEPDSELPRNDAPAKRSPKVWRVGLGEGKLRDLESAIEHADDGDRIELSHPRPLDVNPLKFQGKRLSLVAAARERPIVVWNLPAEPQTGRGLWQIEQGGLTIEGIDFYVDLTKRNTADTELVLFELIESDLRLIDGSITVMSGAVVSRSPVTAIKLVGEHPWDPKGRGEPPPPVQVEIRNSLFRGLQTAVYLDSRQAIVRLENSITCGPGTLVHAFHTRSHEFAHHRLLLELGASTFDLDGPLVTVECRPFELSPVPLEMKVRSTIVGRSSEANPRPAQILWKSPVEDRVVSTAVHWTGDKNCYFHRGEGLQAKSREGPIMTFVQSPSDWQRLGLGVETNWITPDKGIVLPAGPWHRRAPYGYTVDPQQLPVAQKPNLRDHRFGANTKEVANPRTLPAR